MRTAAEMLVSKGIAKGYVQPPICRALWCCGFPVRPYVYISRLKIGIVSFLFLSALWGLGMRLLSWSSWTLGNIIASMAFGFFMALFNGLLHYRAISKFDLPKLSDLLREAQEKQQAEQVAAPDS